MSKPILFLCLICVGLLAACSDDRLSARKARCDLYVKYGYLNAGQGQDCYITEAVFEEAARAAAQNVVRNIYPTLVQSAEKLNREAARFNKENYRPLPSDKADPILLINEDADKDWRYVVNLDRVTFAPPTDGGDAWTISGWRSDKKDNIWSLKIEGVGIYAFRELEGICELFAYSDVGGGCQATVFLDKETEEQITVIVAMAIELSAPTFSDAYRVLLVHEMSQWPPASHR